MKQRGFTLLEMLLSVTIIGILVGISAPVYNAFASRNDLDAAGQQVADALRRAQTYARGNNGDSAWSVEIQPSVVTLFKGTSFASRDTGYDEALSLSGGVTASGLSEVQFAKLTGKPSTTGTITFAVTTNTRTITINAKGVVSY